MDFTYVRSWAGWVYVAFVVDVFAQRIVGWHAATNKVTDLVLTPLRIALWDRDRQGTPVEPGQLLHRTTTLHSAESRNPHRGGKEAVTLQDEVEVWAGSTQDCRQEHVRAARTRPRPRGGGGP